MATYASWPTKAHRFWWMEYTLGKKRGKPKVMLVELIEADGCEYVRPFQDNNCYPKRFCEDWKARFKPCESEPIFEKREE